MEDNVSKIKERLDLVDLISGYLRLQKAGSNFKAICPFHNEKTPSFMVSPSRQIWHCFGCGLSGDHFKFLMQIEGVEFKEALRTLAKRTGVELKHFDKEFQNEKSKLYEISDLAVRFFEKQLWESQNGRKALEYLRSRGLKDQTVKEWRLGYAPNTWNSLKAFLKNAGYSDEEIHKTGLTVKKEVSPASDLQPLTSDFYDRFRGRIMFPISDLNSQVVGFTGRIFESDKLEARDENLEPPASSLWPLASISAKYINTPQTQIYDKSRLLYGLDKAKIDLRKKDRAIVVEGNMDVIMSHQAGVRNAVASSGTALTYAHFKILKRFTQNLDLCFDQDLAGETAAKRGIDLALAQGFNVGVISLANSKKQIADSEKVKDPADLIKEDPEKWIGQSQKSQPIIQFYIEKALARHDSKTAFGKKNIAAEVLTMVRLVENKVEQAHWLDELSGRLKVEQKTLAEAMAAMKFSGRERMAGGQEENSINPAPSPRLVLEETLLALLFKMPEKSGEINQQEFEIFQDQLYNNIFQSLKTSQTFLNPLSYEDNLRFELVKFKSEQFFGDLEGKDLENEIARLIKSLEKELILDKIKELEIKIKEAQNRDEVPLLLKEVQKFSNKLANLT